MPDNATGFWTVCCGRKGVRHVYGTCSSCNQHGALSAYETTRFFSLGFLPVIPAGTEHVLEHCWNCGSKRRVPPEQWESVAAQAVAQTEEDLAANPEDSAAARRAIVALAHAGVDERLLQTARDVAGRFPADTETLKTVAGSYACVGQYEKAAETLKSIPEGTADPQVREMLVVCLVKQGVPDEAHALLQDAVDERREDCIPLLLLLARGYQGLGQHDKAMELLDTCADINPRLQDDEACIRMRETSEDNAQSAAAVSSPELTCPGVFADAPPESGLGLGPYVAPLLLAAVVLCYLFAAFMAGRARTVYVVSGLSQPYTIVINGARHTVSPGAATVIHIPEGTVVLQADPDGLPFPSQQLEISTPFFTRPFLDRTFVINPDQAAPLVHESPKGSAGPDGPPVETAFHLGGTLYTFDDLASIFGNAVLGAKPGSDPEAPVARVHFLGDGRMHPDDVLQTLAHNVGPETAVQLAVARLRYEPDNTRYLRFLQFNTDPKQFVELIRPGLGARPVWTEWHRSYQDVRRTHEPEWDLYKEYSELAAKQPDVPELKYLLGRVSTDPDESRRLFSESVAGEQPCPHGYHGLAFYALGGAEFEKALEYARKAIETSQDQSLFGYTFLQALIGSGQFDEALEKIKAQIAITPWDPTWLGEELQVQVMKGDADAARKAVEDRLNALGSTVPPQHLAALQRRLRADLAYVLGDLEGYAEVLGDDQTPDARFAVALSAGKPDDAAAALDESGQTDVLRRLLLYLAYLQTGDAEKTEATLKKAIEELRAAPPRYGQIARRLSGEVPFEPQLLDALSFDVHGRKVLLTVFAQGDSPHRETCLSLARKLNFKRMFPHLFLKQILEGARPE